jgi:hypothetical protein
MMVEVKALTADLTKPAPIDEEAWVTWEEDMNTMFADMDVGGELWTAPEEEDTEAIDNYSNALINARTQAEGLAAAEIMKQKSTEDSLAATAKAAALNATSAEDAMERVVRAAFMEAVARQIAKIVATVPFPFNIGLAAGAAGIMSGLFDGAVGMAKKMKFAQFGMNEMISQPTLIMAGESGPERISITPISRPSSGQGGGGMTINFLGPVTDREFVRDTIIPEINRVQSLGLA